jgi:hypothetical protein
MPNPAINDVRRGAFDRPQNVGQWKHLIASFIDQRSQNQVDVIWHDHGDVKLVFDAVIMRTGSQNDIASRRRKNPPELGHKSYKKRSIVALKMGKIAPVELHASILSAIKAEAAKDEEKFCNDSQKRTTHGGADASSAPRAKRAWDRSAFHCAPSRATPDGASGAPQALAAILCPGIAWTHAAPCEPADPAHALQAHRRLA